MGRQILREGRRVRNVGRTARDAPSQQSTRHKNAIQVSWSAAKVCNSSKSVVTERKVVRWYHAQHQLQCKYRPAFASYGNFVGHQCNED